MSYSPGNVKMMLSNRGRIDQCPQFTFPAIYDHVIRTSALAADIETFVANELEDRQQDGRLATLDEALVSEVRTALVTGAKGMSLWIVLQLDEICRQDCNQEIRKALESLPKTLEDTYRRMLDRISTWQRSTRAKDIFKWVITARRPLSLAELREALAVEKFARYSDRERLINNITHIVIWCAGLLVLDEVSDEVSFAHPSIATSLTRYYEASDRGSFALDADREAGEICVTYPSFNDFKTDLVKRCILQDITAEHVMNVSLGTANLRPVCIKALQKLAPSHSNSPKIGQHLLQLRDKHYRSSDAYPFLAYASQHWLSHPSMFRQEDRIWPLWLRLLLEDDKYDLALRSRSPTAWYDQSLSLRAYIIRHEHVALLNAIESVQGGLSANRRNMIMVEAASLGKLRVFEATWAQMGREAGDKPSPLYFAAQHNYVKLVRKMLDAGVDADAQAGSHENPLYAASKGGHWEIVDLLIDAVASVNTQGGHYGHALQAATLGGHIKAVRSPLMCGAQVNAQG